MGLADDELIKKSENETFKWITAFLNEVDRIEQFFIAKQNDLINQFILLQDKFRIQAEMYEDEKLAKKAKQE